MSASGIPCRSKPQLLHVAPKQYYTIDATSNGGVPQSFARRSRASMGRLVLVVCLMSLVLTTVLQSTPRQSSRASLRLGLGWFRRRNRTEPVQVANPEVKGYGRRHKIVTKPVEQMSLFERMGHEWNKSMRGVQQGITRTQMQLSTAFGPLIPDWGQGTSLEEMKSGIEQRANEEPLAEAHKKFFFQKFGFGDDGELKAPTFAPTLPVLPNISDIPALNTSEIEAFVREWWSPKVEQGQKDIEDRTQAFLQKYFNVSTMQPFNGSTPIFTLMKDSSLEAEKLRRKLGLPTDPRSLREPGRKIAIFTTASLPWMTGTSVNPLLRAAYLASTGDRQVTLVVPYLAQSDQAVVHPGYTFNSPREQENYVKEWIKNRVGFVPNVKYIFYPGRYAPDKGSILPVGDLTQIIPIEEADVAVLEEPEHLNWYHHGERWTERYNHVVGIMHTNYLEYARREEGGDMKEGILKNINFAVCRAHCHKVIKLSDAVQELPRQETQFIHGVSPHFIQIGKTKAAQARKLSTLSKIRGKTVDDQLFLKGLYFIGKVVWAKGYTELLQLTEYYDKHYREPLQVDVYGGGPDLPDVELEAAEKSLQMTFMGPKDHAHLDMADYKVFWNPSLSDVVATTTAEALAMGKWVVVADHPSNHFFATFDNCLVYHGRRDFVKKINKALSTIPKPLTKEERYRLSWEAATERFLDAGEVKVTDTQDILNKDLLEGLIDWTIGHAHNAATGVQTLRIAAGAGKDTLQAPPSLESWQPDNWQGGNFDRKDGDKKK